MATTSQTEIARIGYKIKEWRAALPVSHSQLSEWIRIGKVPSCKIDGMRLILESRAAFAERHRTAVVK
jgi:predicted site-specific integrase-resolvase